MGLMCQYFECTHAAAELTKMRLMHRRSMRQHTQKASSRLLKERKDYSCSSMSEHSMMRCAAQMMSSCHMSCCIMQATTQRKCRALKDHVHAFVPRSYRQTQVLGPGGATALA